MMTILLAGFAPIPCNAEFRDPTQPAYPLPAAASDAIGAQELVLSAIWISSHSRRATINGVSGKQGQTIVIEQTPALEPEPVSPANAAAANGKKNELLNKATEYSDTKTNRPTQENITSPLGGMNATPSTPQQTNAAPYPETSHIPALSSTIKIVSIKKNTVIIDQNGERKTLQLVQRSYKIQ